MKKTAVRDLLLLILLVAIDRVTKYLCIAYLKPLGSTGKTLIKGVLRLLYLENDGGAFSFFEGGRIFFLIVTVIALIVMLWFYLSFPDDKRHSLYRLVLTVLAAGAVGNMIDRIRWGYVVDFIYVELIKFPIFNFADICITISIAVLMVMIIRGDGRKDEAVNAKETPRKNDEDDSGN